MHDVRILLTAFAEVPSATGIGARMAQWLSAFGGPHVDGLFLRGARSVHIERVAGARVMRVAQDHLTASQRFPAYARALARQWRSDAYQVLWCGDAHSAAVARTLSDAPFVWDLSAMPGPEHDATLAAAAHIVVPSVYARERLLGRTDAAHPSAPHVDAARDASHLNAAGIDHVRQNAARIDAARVSVAVRAIDCGEFHPPSIELARAQVRMLVLAPALDAALVLHTVASMQRRAPHVQVSVHTPPAVADASAFAATLAGADIVVAITDDDDERLAAPYRALQAMATGRCTVLVGAAGLCSDGLVADTDLVVVPADATRVLATLLMLCERTSLRSALGRSAARTVAERFDVRSATHTAFAVLERLGLARHVADPASTATGDAEGGSTSALPLAESSSPASEPARVADLAQLTQLTDTPSFHELAGAYDGDTFLDGASAKARAGLDHGSTKVDAERVKAAMLISSDAPHPPVPLPSTPEAAQTRDGDDDDPAARKRSPPPRSLGLVAAPVSGDDAWAADTIADGPPFEGTQRAEAPVRALPHALLVDSVEVKLPQSDMTDEDAS